MTVKFSGRVIIVKRLDGRQIALILISLVGVILAVVGLFITWYVCKLEADVPIAGHYEEVQTQWLFDEDLNDVQVGINVSVVRGFALTAALLSVAACTFVTLHELVVEINKIFRCTLGLALIICAVFAFIFGLVFAGKMNSDAADLGLSLMKHSAGAGAYLLPIGSIIAAVPLFSLRRS